MTLDEAIENLEQDVEIDMYIHDIAPQLAEWLEDYKRLKNIPEHNYYNCYNLTCRRKCEKDGYNKAIDDFKKMMNIEKIKEYAESEGFININNCSLMIFDIAEQLKDGDGNDRAASSQILKRCKQK